MDIAIGHVGDKKPVTVEQLVNKLYEETKMKLFTKAILDKIPTIGETNHLGMEECMVWCKLFNPVGAGTWYLTEYNPETKEAFAFVNLGDPMLAELGYISIAELEEYRGPIGLGIERDMHFKPMLLKDVWDKVKAGQHV